MPSSQNDVGIFANTLTPRDMGFFSVVVPANTVTALPAISAHVNVLLMQANEDVRYLDNGANTPSGTDGILIPKNTPFQYQVSDFTLIRFFGTTACTLQVLGYSYATRGEA